MILHSSPSPLAGKAVSIVAGALVGQTILIEDWWDRIAGKSWMHCDGNFACMEYALREPTPLNDEVLYGKIGSFGALVHVSMLDAAEGPDA